MSMPIIAGRLAAPLLIFLGAVLLWPHIIENTAMLAGLPGIGPAGWPRFMIAAIGVCSLLWFLRELLLVVRQRRPIASGQAPSSDDEGAYSYTKAVVGLVLVCAYGAAIPQVGFPIATLVFILLWCLLGGVRRPIVFLPVAFIGTLALLYLFVGLATMPLNRGVGVFDAFTIRLFQLLGIY